MLFQKSSFGNPNKLMKNVIVSKIRPSVLSNDSGSVCFWRKGASNHAEPNRFAMVVSSMICSDNSSNSKLCRETAATVSRCTLLFSYLLRLIRAKCNSVDCCFLVTHEWTSRKHATFSPNIAGHCFLLTSFHAQIARFRATSLHTPYLLL